MKVTQIVGKPRSGMMKPSVKTAGKGAHRKGKETPPKLEVIVRKRVLPYPEW